MGMKVKLFTVSIEPSVASLHQGTQRVMKRCITPCSYLRWYTDQMQDIPSSEELSVVYNSLKAHESVAAAQNQRYPRSQETRNRLSRIFKLIQRSTTIISLTQQMISCCIIMQSISIVFSG
jgi:hypothetical protein